MSAAAANAGFQLVTVEPVTFDGFQDFRGREFLFHGTQITKVGGKGWNGENNDIFIVRGQCASAARSPRATSPHVRGLIFLLGARARRSAE